MRGPFELPECATCAGAAEAAGVTPVSICDRRTCWGHFAECTLLRALHGAGVPTPCLVVVKVGV